MEKLAFNFDPENASYVDDSLCISPTSKQPRWKITSVGLLQCTAKTGLLKFIHDALLDAFSGGPFSAFLFYILDKGPKIAKEKFEKPKLPTSEKANFALSRRGSNHSNKSPCLHKMVLGSETDLKDGPFTYQLRTASN